MAVGASCYGALVFVVVLASTSGSLISRRAAGGSAGDICGGNPCPVFTLVKNIESDIEERRYEATQFPSYTSTQCMSYAQALSQGYFYLAMYTRAAQNENKKPLSMGAPVLTKVSHVNDVEPECADIYTTSFYVSTAPLPAPTNPNIKITSLENRHVYVQTIGGYIKDAEKAHVALRLRLNAQGLCYDATTYYIADYQSPGTSTNRRNEIWVPARSCSPLTSQQ